MNAVGIDEVGRGCWAGPLLVVAARERSILPRGVADSKVLSKKKRQTLFNDIRLSCDIGEGWVTATEIDSLGLSGAMRLGVQRAIKAVGAGYADTIIMDGNTNYCGSGYTNVQCVIDADASHPIVSAASIYAKVLRDNYMSALDGDYKNYQFEKHVGYGTKLHKEMLLLHGVTDLHRRSFAPIRALGLA